MTAFPAPRETKMSTAAKQPSQTRPKQSDPLSDGIAAPGRHDAISLAVADFRPDATGQALEGFADGEQAVCGRTADAPTGAATAGTAVEGGLLWAKNSKTLVLRIGECLDLSINALVQQAIQALEASRPERVVVDLTATRKVFDSGMALLLLLRNRAGHLRDRIYLTNCAPRICSRLARAGIASQFRIAGEVRARAMGRA